LPDKLYLVRYEPAEEEPFHELFSEEGFRRLTRNEKDACCCARDPNTSAVIVVDVKADLAVGDNGLAGIANSVTGVLNMGKLTTDVCPRLSFDLKKGFAESAKENKICACTATKTMAMFKWRKEQCEDTGEGKTFIKSYHVGQDEEMKKECDKKCYLPWRLPTVSSKC